jgi:hypothetical protein
LRGEQRQKALRAHKNQLRTHGRLSFLKKGDNEGPASKDT